MADLGTTVDTDGVSGDYSTLQAAETAEQQDLTDGDGDTFTFTCSATTGVADGACGVSGWTTALGEDITIIVASGHEAKKDGIDISKYRISGSSGGLLTINEDYVNIKKIQIVSSGCTSYDQIIKINSQNASNEIIFDKIYFQGGGLAGGTNEQAFGVNDADVDVTIQNSIIYNVSQRCLDLDAGTVNLYNNSFRGSNSRAGIETAAGTTLVAKNNAVFNTTDDFNISGTSTLDYNASDDGDGSNAQTPSGSDWDNEFNDSANGDFTLLTGGNCEDNGVGPGTDSNVPTTDIDGTTRSGTTCDIGVDEYATAGATGNPWYYYAQM